MLLNDKIEKLAEQPVLNAQFLPSEELSREQLKQLQDLRDQAVELFSRAETSISILYSSLIQQLPKEVKQEVDAFKSLVNKFQDNTRAMSQKEVTALVKLTNKLLGTLESNLKEAPEVKVNLKDITKVLAEQLRTPSLTKQARFRVAKEATTVLEKSGVEVPPELKDLSKAFWASNRRFSEVADILEKSSQQQNVLVDTTKILQDLPSASVLAKQFDRILDSQSELGADFEQALLIHGQQISASISQGVSGFTQATIASIGGMPALILDELFGVSDRIGEVVGDKVSQLTQKALGLITKPFASLSSRIRRAIRQRALSLFSFGREAGRRLLGLIRRNLPNISFFRTEEKLPVQKEQKEPKVEEPKTEENIVKLDDTSIEKSNAKIVSKLNKLISIETRQVRKESEDTDRLVKEEKKQSKYIVKKLTKELDDIEIATEALGEEEGGIIGGGGGGFLSGLMALPGFRVLGRFAGKAGGLLRGAGKVLGKIGKLGIPLAAGSVAGSEILDLGVKGAGKVFEKVAPKAGGKVLGKLGSKAVGKVLGKEALKVGEKGLFKTALKKVPFLGALAGMYFGYDRLKEGDLLGAAAEVASGALGIYGLPIDAFLAARDLSKAQEGIKKPSTATPPFVPEGKEEQGSGIFSIFKGWLGESGKAVAVAAPALEQARQQAQEAYSQAAIAVKARLTGEVPPPPPNIESQVAEIKTKMSQLPSYTASLSAPEVNREAKKTIADEFASKFQTGPQTKTTTPSALLPVSSQGRRAADSPVMLDDLGLILLNSGVF